MKIDKHVYTHVYVYVYNREIIYQFSCDKAKSENFSHFEFFVCLLCWEYF